MAPLGERVAVIGARSPVGSLLAQLTRESGNLSLAVEESSASVEAIARAADVAFLVLPRGEARELGLALVARGVRVIDLGGDQRGLAQVPDALGENAGARAALRGKRLLSLPSAAAQAAFLATSPLLEAKLLVADRLALLLCAGDAIDASTPLAPSTPGASLLAEPGTAAELSFLLEQRRWPALRLTSTLIRAPLARGILLLALGDLAREEGGSEAELLRALTEASPPWVRVCRAGEHADTARVLGSGTAEVSVSADGFAERVTVACAVDAVQFSAHAALRALEFSRAVQAVD